jgi:pyruvate-formate lyase-activating enzyme
MCNGYFSSAISQEESVLFNNKSIEASLPNQLRVQALADIIKYLPQCEKIYFAGGEPLLTAEHYEILQALIECGNTELEIFYNTNFTTLKYRDQHVLDLWSKFSKITVGASLDAEKEVAEYVRYGTDWNLVEKNLELVKLRCPHVNMTVTSVVGFLTVKSLIDLQQSWHDSSKLHISKFSLNVMIGPTWMTVAALPRLHKERLEKLITNHILWCRNQQAFALADQWTSVLNYMWSKDDSHYLSEFRRLTKMLDNHRGVSLEMVLPEYKELLYCNLATT